MGGKNAGPRRKDGRKRHSTKQSPSSHCLGVFELKDLPISSHSPLLGRCDEQMVDALPWNILNAKKSQPHVFAALSIMRWRRGLPSAAGRRGFLPFPVPVLTVLAELAVLFL
jgi:hypothetical protein